MPTHSRISKRDEGFTLIELMIVVAIMAILVAIAIPQLSLYRAKSYNTAATSDLKNAAIAQEAYYVDNRLYTNSIANLTTDPYNLNISQGVNIGVSSATKLKPASRLPTIQQGIQLTLFQGLGETYPLKHACLIAFNDHRLHVTKLS